MSTLECINARPVNHAITLNGVLVPMAVRRTSRIWTRAERAEMGYTRTRTATFAPADRTYAVWNNAGSSARHGLTYAETRTAPPMTHDAD